MSIDNIVAETKTKTMFDENLSAERIVKRTHGKNNNELSQRSKKSLEYKRSIQVPKKKNYKGYTICLIINTRNFIS